MSYHCLGDFSKQRIAYPEDYFRSRDCWLDCRISDGIEIEDGAQIGWCVRIICATHNPAPGMFNEVTGRRVVIRRNAFVGGFALLYNCEIGEGAVVACGSVVRCCRVEPWTMVEGNPAKPFKRLNPISQKWERI
jgi:acetyltransferase-like isoleucine patch superfamily enzyme